jgi:hypothetical protein
MIEMATRVGANVVPIRAQWGEPFPEELEKQDFDPNSPIGNFICRMVEAKEVADVAAIFIFR